MREVKIMKKEPGKSVQKDSVMDNYREIQKYVGGFFQCVSMPGSDTINIICADEGKLEGMQANIYLPEYRDLVVGNIIFAAYNEDGEMRDLTNEETEQISNYCGKNKALEIDPNSSEYQSFIRVEVYFDDGKNETVKKDDLDMGE